MQEFEIQVLNSNKPNFIIQLTNLPEIDHSISVMREENLETFVVFGVMHRAGTNVEGKCFENEYPLLMVREIGTK